MDDDDTRPGFEAPPGLGQDPRDDWLGINPDLDWFADRDPSDEQPRRRRVSPLRSSKPPRDPDYVLDPEVRRRRMIAAGGIVAILVVVVVLVVALGSGGSKPLVTTTASTPTTTAKTTTTKTTTKKTTTTKTSTTLKVVLPASGKLQLGDSGAAVKTLQQALVKLDSGALTPDGNFGSLTERAVSAFQTAHGLTGDGVVGAQTAAAINTALAAAAP